MLDRVISTVGAIAQFKKEQFRTEAYRLSDAESNQSILTFSSVISLEFATDGEVVSAPIEEGSFTTYNKSLSANSIKSTLAIMGENDALQAALKTLGELEKSVKKVNFITPFEEYRNYSLENYTFTLKSENTLNVLFVDITLVEVREVEPAYTDTKAKSISTSSAKKAGNASTKNNGKQQGKDLSSFAYDSAQTEWGGKIIKGVTNLFKGRYL